MIFSPIFNSYSPMKAKICVIFLKNIKSINNAQLFS